MSAADRLELRETFNRVAERYDRIRPTYPAPLFDDLAGAGATPGSRVLEIGCGTGQATIPLAERGYRLLAVELGPELAAVARRNLARFGDSVQVVTGAFERWPLPDEPFDVVFSATAFHWIDPEVRMAKSADALRPGGLLATVTTHHVLGGTVGFFAEMQEYYERFDPATPPGLRLRPADEIPRDDAEVSESSRFGPATFHRHEFEVSYSTAEYLDLLLTYSNHLALPEADRKGLLDGIAGLIDDRYDGRVVKRYLNELRLTTREV
ncbi:class I SAM-dependent methyltransferase [Micromonospora sp. NPDC050397]|uniref:class I SAM-dependent methyltransferase n=1 Tax=Micromonospora sp. NPDC050397 TaxID=3364279 RepID=UPI00385097C9